jgi:hypothetical protein
MVSKADYLDYMQGSGYETSPIFQQGFEKWDPKGIESLMLEQKFGSPLNKYWWDAEGMAGKDTGMYVPEPDKTSQEIKDDAIRLFPGDEESQNTYIKNQTENITNPWQKTMGHETSHLGFDYDNPFRKGLAEVYGGINPLGEENWNYMHDLMYGTANINNPWYLDYQRKKLINRGLYSLPTPVFGGQYVSGPAGRRIRKPIGFTPGGWNPNTYDKIRSSGLVDWQKGMLMQGPTTAAGQIALGQTPAQVQAQGQAYMDPNRGNVQAPTMTQQQMVQEAQQTGGTVNPHEATQAAWQPDYSGAVASQQSQAAEAGQTHEQFMSDLDAVMAKGGLVSVNHLTRRL